MCEYLHQYPEYCMNLMGICEETTTGVARLKKKYQNNQLRYPAVAINDAKSKYLFDNRYGTGQSTLPACIISFLQIILKIKFTRSRMK